MKLENKKIIELKPLAQNVRKHNDNQINELIRSVKQFGQTRAIVIDEDNNILIGNGLYLALAKMGVEDCQCYKITGLTEIQKKKLVLTDNRVYSLGSDDYAAINDYIQEITVAGDFDIAGFDESILQGMTISDEENESLMQDYGKITDIKFTQEQQEQPQATAPQQTIKADKAADKVNIVAEKEVSAPTIERKYVVCPNCGEVIYID